LPICQILAKQGLAVLTDDRFFLPVTLLTQAGVSLGLAALLGFWQGKIVAVSALAGGMAVVIPNAFLAARLMAPRAGESAKALMRSAWIGEIGKLLLTVLLFGTIFALLRPISPPAVFGGFIAAQLVVFAALLFDKGAATAK
jgi:ATP synthase protein I